MGATSWLVAAILALPWLGALVLALWPSDTSVGAPERVTRSGAPTSRIAGSQPAGDCAAGWVALGAAAASALALGALLSRGGALDGWTWTLGGVSLALDAVALPFLLTVSGVTVVSIWYGWGYLDHCPRPRLCYALVLAFMGSMVGALLATDVLVFFAFWEAMLVASSLLIAGWGEGPRVGPVALKYFVYTQAGSALVLVGLAWLVDLTGSLTFAGMAAGMGNVAPQAATWIALLLVAGFCVKLAVFPVHTWLPDAHSVAPMPVTIMLAGAMLCIGCYGILRVPVMTMSAAGLGPLQAPLLVGALVTQVYGALMCFTAQDVKRIIAYSSVSQMGYVLYSVATLNALGISGGLLHVVNHGALKAALFMGVGLVMRATGRRRIDELGDLFRAMPAVAMGLSFGAVALAGMPPFGAFASEWLIYEGGLNTPYPLLGYLELAAPLATAAYALWFVGRVVLGPPAPPEREVAATPGAMRWSFYAVLGAALALGFFPGPLHAWAGRASALLLGGG